MRRVIHLLLPQSHDAGYLGFVTIQIMPDVPILKPRCTIMSKPTSIFPKIPLCKVGIIQRSKEIKIAGQFVRGCQRSDGSRPESVSSQVAEC